MQASAVPPPPPPPMGYPAEPPTPAAPYPPQNTSGQTAYPAPHLAQPHQSAPQQQPPQPPPPIAYAPHPQQPPMPYLSQPLASFPYAPPAQTMLQAPQQVPVQPQDPPKKKGVVKVLKNFRDGVGTASDLIEIQQFATNFIQRRQGPANAPTRDIIPTNSSPTVDGDTEQPEAAQLPEAGEQPEVSVEAAEIPPPVFDGSVDPGFSLPEEECVAPDPSAGLEILEIPEDPEEGIFATIQEMCCSCCS